MNIILGNGISAYIIAACLEYRKEKFKIYADTSRKCNIPNILYLSCKNYDSAKFYLSIFNITDIDKYIKQIKVGYYYDNKINDTLTMTAKVNYLKKQNRKITNSCLSDSQSNYLAIDLTTIVANLINKYSIENISKYNFSNNDIIYDTMRTNNNIIGTESKEYLVENTYFDVKDYDYVYDCSDSNIKRFTKTTIEYIIEPKEKHIAITNYYDSPTIYKYNNITVLGRYATKTQMKQIDIINYLILNEGNVVYV